ncbi:orotidine-5'-phosphate decarboxylase [Nadsonia fulvescens var. elongata DSM 6958]|uniref:Orotidine 5'-phosphate decarboxylase n=1 Tax=Nadsonia fulvescens var. elongata DSM 6958 TaxID=857566 RepID=A0A1E3PET0_9ASCO|nr:orotidine-5'-phosphate decarboxylase [Nadsonia fulvescens var. elongata DSM 6958]
MSTYEQRAKTHQSPLASRLLSLMAAKRTNLCASVDLTSTAELLALVDTIGPYICVVKTHIDIVSDFTYEGTAVALQKLARKHGFLIFEDRKFADIGNTVKHQYVDGIYRIAEWADITNAHGVTGTGVVRGLKEASKWDQYLEPKNEDFGRGLLMLAELSSAGSLAKGEYTAGTIDIARSDPSFVFGFIAQNAIPPPPSGEKEDWIIMTPGVGLDDKGDGLGQQYRTADEVIQTGTDIIIVGRGIYGKGRDPVAEAKRYREAGWIAYEKKVSGN